MPHLNGIVNSCRWLTYLYIPALALPMQSRVCSAWYTPVVHESMNQGLNRVWVRASSTVRQ